MTLDAVIEDVLESSGKPLSVRQITDIIQEKKLWYRPKDNKLPAAEQVSARVNNYPHKFVRQNGVVTLRNRSVNEQRIARLAFNKNGWIYPSGPEGKSKSKDSYEYKNGYAHEEWLLDMDKAIDGYHYGFLEPINKNHQKYIGCVFDIFLFTVNSHTNERFWVGKLKNVEVIDGKTSDKVKEVYRKKGWYKEMVQDLKELELDPHNFGRWHGIDLFNIRFRPDDFEKYPDKTYVAKGDKSISSYHYVLLHAHQLPEIEKGADGVFELGRCNPTSRYSGKSIKKRVEEKLVEYPALHHQISVALEATLKKEYDKVYAEHQTGYKTSIDLVAVKGKKMHFFEIKTYHDVRTCIRQALGQLLEYSYFPDRQLADELYIVTPHEIHDQNIISYIKTLKESVGVPIRYITYDLVKRAIVQMV